MGARLLNSCQIEIFEARQNSLLLLHDIPWQGSLSSQTVFGVVGSSSSSRQPKKVAIKKSIIIFFEMKAKAAPHLVLRMSTKKGGIYLREFLSYFQLGNFLTFFCRFCIFTNIKYTVETGYIT